MALQTQVTLKEMRDAVRDDGEYENSTVHTDAILNRRINWAARTVYSWLIEQWQHQFTVSKLITTSPNVEAVKLPSDFFKLLGLDLKITSVGGGTSLRFLRLRRFEFTERNDFHEAAFTGYYGRSFRYRVQGPEIILSPLPTAAETLRIFYIPHLQKLEQDTDKFDAQNGWDELVVEYTLLRCDMREDKPLSGREANIERIKQWVITDAAGRDAAEPYLLQDLEAWNWGY